MLYSKRLKDRVKFSIKDLIPNRVLRFFRNLIRACQYFKQGWGSKDWDYSFIFDDLIFKLKRVEVDLKNDIYHEPEKLELQSIRLVIKLLEKYNTDRYYYYRNLHEAKWGVGEMIFSKDEQPRVSIFRKNVIPGENEEQERKEFLIAVKADAECRRKDLDLAFKIIQKHCQTWWT
jgi:hypothetical protein